MATHSSILAWRKPGTRSQVGCRLWGRAELDTTEVNFSSSNRFAIMGTPNCHVSEMNVAQSCPTLGDPMDYSPL